jgi:hypothetical protein
MVAIQPALFYAFVLPLLLVVKAAMTIDRFGSHNVWIGNRPAGGKTKQYQSERR